jgi:hypothetical protein
MRTVKEESYQLAHLLNLDELEVLLTSLGFLTWFYTSENFKVTLNEEIALKFCSLIGAAYVEIRDFPQNIQRNGEGHERNVKELRSLLKRFPEFKRYQRGWRSFERPRPSQQAQSKRIVVTGEMLDGLDSGIIVLQAQLY